MTACASCYARLRTANERCRGDAAEQARIARLTAAPYDGGVEVLHILDMLVNRLGIAAIRAGVQRPLAGLRVACYYGCLLSRPPQIVAFDDPNQPTCMDELASAAGAEAVAWPYTTECCGASLAMSEPATVSRLGHRLLSMARRSGAACVVVACPLCQMNLDLRQRDAVEAHGELPPTPVLYITQLLGLALGLSAKQLGLGGLTVRADGLFDSRGGCDFNRNSRGCISAVNGAAAETARKGTL